MGQYRPVRDPLASRPRCFKASAKLLSRSCAALCGRSAQKHHGSAVSKERDLGVHRSHRLDVGLAARIVDQLVSDHRLTAKRRHRLRRRLAEIDNQIALLEARPG
jgi:hypothetical protein